MTAVNERIDLSLIQYFTFTEVFHLNQTHIEKFFRDIKTLYPDDLYLNSYKSFTGMMLDDNEKSMSETESIRRTEAVYSR